MVLFVIRSWHWPLVGDAPLMHYAVFLMQHSQAPYRDIIDLNQPGTFAIEAVVMRVLGPGALAWRIWDLLLLSSIGLVMASLCHTLRAGWFAPLFAGATFALIHARDGLAELGQRDLLIGALLACAYALLFRVVFSARGPRHGASLAAGLCLGAACTIKPQALILIPFLLALTAFQLRKRTLAPAGGGWQAHLGMACAGVALPLLASLAFLLRERALPAYLNLMLHLAAYHAETWRLTPGQLFGRAVSSVLLPLFCLWLPVFLLGQRWRRFPDQALLLGFVFGLFSFYVQGRGYAYHRYPSEVFLLLLAALAFTQALAPGAAPGWQRSIVRGCSIAGLVFGALIVVPRSLAAATHFNWRHDPPEAALRADLTSLGGPALNGHVQCMEQASYCIAALYRMRLVQSTGFLYDCYLFPAADQAMAQLAERDRYRRAFQQAWLQNPPRVVVVSSEECGPPDFQYAKLARWPWFAAYLSQHYSLAREWVPTARQSWTGKPILPDGFRIYTMRSSNSPSP